LFNLSIKTADGQPRKFGRDMSFASLSPRSIIAKPKAAYFSLAALAPGDKRHQA